MGATLDTVLPIVRNVRTGRNRVLSRRESIGAPIFIVGCGHSGTTLVLAMLSAHRRIFSVPYETQFIVLSAAEIQKFVSEFDENTISAGKYRWVEKSPVHIYNIDSLLTYFGDARIILMLRDGRDVAVSFRDRTGDIDAGVRRWIDNNRAGEPFWRHQAVLVVRYEELIAAPGATLQSICTFLGESFDPAMLRHHESDFRFLGHVAHAQQFRGQIHAMTEKPRSASGSNHRLYRSWQAKQPLFDGRGRWKGALSAKERSLLKDLAGPTLIRYGYASDLEW